MKDTTKHRLNRYVPLRRVWFEQDFYSLRWSIESREFGSRIGYCFPVILSIMFEDLFSLGKGILKNIILWNS